MAAPLVCRYTQLQAFLTPCRNIAFLRRKATLRNRSNRTRPSEFSVLLKKRHNQAQKSVLIRSQHPENTLKVLQKYGQLAAAFFTSPEQGYLLVEFTDSSSVQHLLDKSSFFLTSNQFPLRSRCLCDFTAAGRRIKNGRSIKISHFPQRSDCVYPSLGSLEEEMMHLHNSKTLNELDLRLRFMMCVLIEDAVKVLVSNDICVVPFGSCLNGFGWANSDLDMMLCFHKDPFTMEVPTRHQDTDLKFLTEIFHSDRKLAHHSLMLMSSLLELMPRISRVQRILHARVPILRFNHMTLNLDCDISLHSLDSIKMTELLYLLSKYDWRLKMLMTCIKEWAICHDQTSSGERQKPTTIGLLFLLIFFLQTRSPPVLPSLNQVQEVAEPSDSFVVEDVHYRLPHSYKRIPPSMNKESIGSLLHGFFDFYATFDFESHGISITDGKSIFPKTDPSPLLIENPLCIGLNIGKNVSSSKLSQFQQAVQEAGLKLKELQAQEQARRSLLSSFLSDWTLSGNSTDIEIETILSEFGDQEVAASEECSDATLNDSENNLQAVSRSRIKE